MSRAGAHPRPARFRGMQRGYFDDRRPFEGGRRRPGRRRRPQDTSFEADRLRLLHLMVHSGLTRPRHLCCAAGELISNAADAGGEKLRYEALAKPGIDRRREPLRDHPGHSILDKKTLTFSDNGGGMSRQDLVEALGTIARSGIRAGMEEIAAQSPDKEAKEATSLIGQFGIGLLFVLHGRRGSDRRSGDERATPRPRAGHLTRKGQRLHDRPIGDRRGRADARHAGRAASQRRVARIRRGLADCWSASCANILG